jgi:hypothetical protein
MPAKNHPSRTVVNGEAKAEDEARAKAQAEAEAKKAEAEAAAKKAAANDEALDRLRPELIEAGQNLESAQAGFGNVLFRAEGFLPSVRYSGIQAFAEDVVPDLCGPIWTSSPAYRSLQAARVVASIGADKVQATSVDALTFLHRFTPEQRTEVFAKAKGRSRKPKVSKASLVEAAKALYGEDGDKAGKGPAKGSGKAGNGAKAKARKAEKAAQAETVQGILDAIAAIRPDGEPSEAEGPIVKEALASIGKVLQGHVDEYGGDAYSAGLAMLTATVDLCETFTVPVVRAALRVREEAAKKETAKPTATPRKARNTRNTRKAQ